MSKSNLQRIVALIPLLVTVAGLLVVVDFQGVRMDAVSNTRARRAAYAFADRLRQTSDDLTRMVRLYALTGEPVYREYFEEILAIRNGEAPRPAEYFNVPYWDIVLHTGEHFGPPGPAVPIRTLASNAGLLEDELAELANAEAASSELAVIENEIMDVVAAQVDAGGGYSLEGEALQGALRLHSQEYHASRASVMNPLVELGRKIDAAYVELLAMSRSIFDTMLRNAGLLLLAAFLAICVDSALSLRSLRRASGPGNQERRSRRRALLMSALALVGVAIGLTFVTNYQRAIQGSASQFVAARRAALSFSDGLRQTSDDLTRMARLYAVTGEQRYRDYFEEILDIRNGLQPRPDPYFDVPYWDILLDTGERPGQPGAAIPIRNLAGDAGLLEAELAEFARAEDASNDLAQIEFEVMDVVAAQIENAGGDYALEGEALQAMLRLHGPEYHAAKARVMQPLVELARTVREAQENWSREFGAFNERSMELSVNLLALSSLLLLGGLWLRRGQI